MIVVGARLECAHDSALEGRLLSLASASLLEGGQLEFLEDLVKDVC